MQLHVATNGPAQARRDTGLRLSTEARPRRCLKPDGSPFKCVPSLLFIHLAKLLVNRIQSCDDLIEAFLHRVKQRHKEKENYQEDDGIGHIVV